MCMAIVGKHVLQLRRTRDGSISRPFLFGLAGFLSGAPAWLDCRVEGRLDTGDRTVYLAKVLDGRIKRMATPLTLKRLLELAPAERLQ
jgi:Flavin reductase like domain